jgi:predicted nucleotide-binding protein
MKDKSKPDLHFLDEFLAPIANLEKMSPRELVELLSFYLTEVQGEPSVRPARLKACFDHSRIKAPGNISQVIASSRSFVRTENGLQLDRSVSQAIRARLQTTTPAAKMPVLSNASSGTTRERNVTVVYGRDRKLRDSMFQFLRSLGLNPLEWEQAVKETGKGSPYVGEILNALFGMSQAVVVMLTPDERVQLRRELCRDDEEFKSEVGYQSRPNVFLEAGMALARDEDRTIMVEIGQGRSASDLSGRHNVRLDNSAVSRKRLAQRLETAKCAVNMDGEDWLTSGDFNVAPL